MLSKQAAFCGSSVSLDYEKVAKLFNFEANLTTRY